MLLRFLLLIDFLFSIAPAASTPAPSRIPTHPSFLNLTSAHELALLSNRSAVASDTSKSHCTPTERWNRPAMQQSDCRGVLAYFFYETMSDGGRTRVEFMSPGAKRMRRGEWQKTPRKYTFRTCTLALIIIRDFPAPATLPGGHRTGPPTALPPYFNLNRVAADLVDDCVLGRGEAGWQSTGQYDGIGVFVWSTDSLEDEEIEHENAGARFAFPIAETASGDGAAAVS